MLVLWVLVLVYLSHMVPSCGGYPSSWELNESIAFYLLVQSEFKTDVHSVQGTLTYWQAEVTAELSECSPPGSGMADQSKHHA